VLLLLFCFVTSEAREVVYYIRTAVGTSSTCFNIDFTNVSGQNSLDKNLLVRNFEEEFLIIVLLNTDVNIVSFYDDA